MIQPCRTSRSGFQTCLSHRVPLAEPADRTWIHGARGYCSFGAQCRYAHSEQEVRPPEILAGGRSAADAPRGRATGGHRSDGHHARREPEAITEAAPQAPCCVAAAGAREKTSAQGPAMQTRRPSATLLS